MKTIVRGGSGHEYIYLNGQPLAQIDDVSSSDVITYLHTDHLGTPRIGSDASGYQVWAWASDAFGNGAPSGIATVNLRFAGQYYDAESGLYYNWNRYYDPQTGHYISSDPIGLAGGLNTFAYVGANPVMYTDPMGLAAAYCDGVIGCDNRLGGGGVGGRVLAVGAGMSLGQKILDACNNWWNDTDIGKAGNSSKYIPPPQTLPAFPDAVPVKGKGGRKRWKDSKGNIYEWDSQHGKVEIYDKTGKKHKGEYDPDTGEQTKPPEKGRTTEK